MQNKTKIILFCFFCLLYSNQNSAYSNYSELINDYPMFISNNYFEDDNFYYYLVSKDISKKMESRSWKRNEVQRLENEFSKLRLNAITELTENICCGFNVKNGMSNVRYIHRYTNEQKRYSISTNHLTEMSSSPNILLKSLHNNTVIFALKSKDNK